MGRSGGNGSELSLNDSKRRKKERAGEEKSKLRP